MGELVGMTVGTGDTELDGVMVGRGMSRLLVLKIASTGSIILKVHLTKDETVMKDDGCDES